LKIATADDFEDLNKMALNFLAASPYKDHGNPEVISAFIKDIINGDPAQKIILMRPTEGFVAGMVTPFIFGSDPLATEIAWWVEPDKRSSGIGAELHKALEYWAKNVANCKFMSMASLDKTVEKYYKKNGYKLYERAYMKVL